VQLVDPLVPTNVPAAQLVQVEEPDEAEKLPAAHDAQVDAEPAPVALLAVPAAHLVHVDALFAPTVVLYVPVPHAVQVVEPDVVL
jgi:hypothetical protein